MLRIRLGICLIAVAAAGCSSHPPREVPPEAETTAGQQGQGFVALPAAETLVAEQAIEQQAEGFSALAQAGAQAAEQAPKRQYNELIAIPEAESRAVRFYLGAQTFDYIEDGNVLVSGPIASGKASSPTPTGEYAILSKDEDKESSKYTNEVGTQAWMPYSMQFYGNYFMHEGWLPGHPASHGCIRMGHHHAKLLFERMKIGDPVLVSN